MLTRVTCTPSMAGSFSGGIPSGLAASWYLVVAEIGQCPSHCIVILRLGSNQDKHLPNECVLARPFARNPFGRKLGVFYIPAGQERLQAKIHGQSAAPSQIDILLIPLNRLAASLLLPCQNLGAFFTGFKTGTGGLAARLREGLLRTAEHGQYFPRDYASWTSWFEPAPMGEIRRLAALPAMASTISVLVFPAAGAACAKTLESLQRQLLPACDITIAGPGKDWAGNGAYVALLQAGEIVPPQALLVLAEALVQHDFPLILMADEDQITVKGTRSSPLFKPEPSLTLICSGLLSRGIWLVRRSLLGALNPQNNQWAECVRLAAWFAAWRQSQAMATHRLPYILTHRGADTPAAPAAALASEVTAFLDQAGFMAKVEPSFPLRVSWGLGAIDGKVSLLVPSRLQGGEQLTCMTKILKNTNYDNFEMLVLVMQPGPLSAGQQDAAAQLIAAGAGNVRVALLAAPGFNYSAANNHAASLADGEFICLLNDDVAPMEGDWLSHMLGFFQDPHCGAVGPRLLYPDRRIQHAGVIAGLSGFVDHANRFLGPGEPGYAHRALLDQEYSAVTGACLLVRRQVFEAAGGLDTAYASAFNDIDFCLRLREQGLGIVYAGSVAMIHHESLTFVRHYAAGETTRLNEDVVRFRLRWAYVLQDDPFYNPNLSLNPNSDWQLAYPPRTELMNS